MNSIRREEFCFVFGALTQTNLLAFDFQFGKSICMPLYKGKPLFFVLSHMIL